MIEIIETIISIADLVMTAIDLIKLFIAWNRRKRDYDDHNR